MVKAVIFDLDDTLISERKYILSGYHHLSKMLSDIYDKEEQEIYQMLIALFGQSPRNVFNRLLDKLEINYTQDNILDLVKEYRNHLPTIEFFDDVVPCLEFLKNKRLKVGIITDGYANAQRKKLDAVGAYNYFDEVIVTDELGREYWKPHPKAFEEMKKKMNVEFDEMLYVGDNPEKDFYISSIFPIKTVRISRETNGCESLYNSRKYYKEIKENHKIAKLGDLSKLVDLPYIE